MPTPVTDTITLADAWLESVLGGDSTIQAEAPGGVWNEAAEQDTQGVVIIYVHRGGASAQDDGAFGNLTIINDDLIYEVHRYLVKAVGGNNRFEDLRAAATRVKQLLHKASGDVPGGGGKILWCRYRTPHKERKPEGDQFYPELGGYYQIAVQPIA